MKSVLYPLAILWLAQPAVAQNPPVADIIPYKINVQEERRVDNYHWLRDDTRQNKTVLNYLAAENAFTASTSQKWRTLSTTLLDEMRARQSADHFSLPFEKGNYEYKTQWQPGADYPSLVRRANNSAQWQPVFDANKRRIVGGYYSLMSYAVSDDNRWLVIGEDLKGDGQATLSVLDMVNHHWQQTSLKNTSGNVVFAPDNQGFYYVENAVKTLTPDRVRYHALHASLQDITVYHESDGRFYTGIARSASDRYLMIIISGNDTSEARLLDLHHPHEKTVALRPRASGVEYYADHIHGQFYVRSNHQQQRFSLFHFTEPNQKWLPWFTAEDESEINDFTLLDNGIILTEKKAGNTVFTRLSYDKTQRASLNFPDKSYMARLGNNSNPHSNRFNYIYSSLNTPLGYYQWHLGTKKAQLIHQKKFNGVDLSRYETRYLEIPVRDGERVPVSLVWRSDRFQPGKNPLLAYGYGAYGISLDAAFSAPRVSLLDRGFVFALVHVRGGGEKGAAWYQQGKKQHKQNSFNDFVDAANALAQQGFADSARLYAMGGSAGGTLVAAAINQQPALFRAAVLQVPFVDVLNTLADSSLPLTQQEFAEWGNPAVASEYQTLRAWSPYDNLHPAAYPSMLITTGLHDSRVPYWEAAKYLARLRAVNRNPKAVQLLSTNMQAGHGGTSGRYSRLADTAEAFSFLLYIDNNEI